MRIACANYLKKTVSADYMLYVVEYYIANSRDKNDFKPLLFVGSAAISMECSGWIILVLMTYSFSLSAFL